ncbi:MAG: chitobiase/beta-hexosaminidase C-terminal domain-containing protein, partial [Melioribacteraceae bacterium]|nr:chitobiase/beta-hexosaminidase C-terminal domain-containing protein [Melioribacteraceae bacterium]
WEFGNVDVPPNGYLLVFASDKDRKGENIYWNTIIDWGDEWRYITPNSEVDENWINANYDDTDWFIGSTGIGYGDNDDETIISPSISLFARKKFNIENIENVIGAVLHIDFDDSFVAYLNGTEIARANIGTTGIPPNFDDRAISDEFEAKIYQGGFPSRYDIENIEGLIFEGENILAVQIHNLDLGSSDLSFIPFFTLQQNSPLNASNPPELLQLSGSNIHANFKLKSSGELITLANQDGVLLDSVNSGILESDISFGRQPDGGEQWFYFASPTPNSSNITAASDSLLTVDSVLFSPQGGFYSSNISLSLTSTNANSRIFYTSDGSVPNENSKEYTRPISISRTMVIRTVAINPSGRKSEVHTNTYFIGEDRPLPVFSISTSPPNFDRLYENFDAEVPINIEMYERDGTQAFNHKAGAEVFGSGSAGFEQKSISIFFRGKYGVGELKYPMFPDRPFEEYESFILRNGGNDWWSTLIRDPMTSTGLMRGTNLDFQAYRPSIVYV